VRGSASTWRRTPGFGFSRTGRFAQYGALDAIEHELLSLDLTNPAEVFAGHVFEAFFLGIDYREVVLPRRLPALGLGTTLAEAA
jgi:hypothetical protein